MLVWVPEGETVLEAGLEVAPAPVTLLTTEEAEDRTDEALHKEIMMGRSDLKRLNSYVLHASSTHALEAEATAEEIAEVAPPTTPPAPEEAAEDDEAAAEEAAAEAAEEATVETGAVPVLVTATVEPAEVPAMA